VTGNLRDHGLDVRKVGRAGVALGSAHGNEDGLALFHSATQIGREIDQSAPVLGQQLGKVFLVDGHAAIAEGLDPGFVIVHAENAMAHLSKTGCCNESHIP
jgi:hypothetical protein